MPAIGHEVRIISRAEGCLRNRVGRVVAQSGDRVTLQLADGARHTLPVSAVERVYRSLGDSLRNDPPKADEPDYAYTAD